MISNSQLKKYAAQSFAELEAALRPGDIIVASPKAPGKGTGAVARAFGKAFRRISTAVQGDKTHSMLYTGDGTVIETRIGSGIATLGLRDALRGLDATAVRPKLGPEERQAAVRRAEALAAAGTPYDTTGLVRALLSVGTDKAPTEAVTCSTLISAAYEPKITDAPRDATKPVDFLRSDKVRHVIDFVNPGRRDRGKP